MSSGFINKPRILKGAFIESGLSLPPLIVPFQFNPEELTRNRTATFAAPDYVNGENQSLRAFHEREKNLSNIRKLQEVTVSEEEYSFDIRLDATDALNDGEIIAGLTGVDPQLAALELMLHPKPDSPFEILRAFRKRGYTFAPPKNPPLILFIWGLNKILPVNITAMNIKEMQHDARLFPVRATVSVSLAVIEGPNLPYSIHELKTKVMGAVNFVNVARKFMEMFVPL